MFLSSFENRIDKKGRVSVPATFRSHLNSMGYNGFISYPSFNHLALVFYLINLDESRYLRLGC